MMCQEDSGSMTGCRPICDAPAVRVLTYRPSCGPVLVTRLCDRHADHLPARIWPYLVTDDRRI
jgi:hypothetical protein